jgi:hypothetical protein
MKPWVFIVGFVVALAAALGYFLLNKTPESVSVVHHLTLQQPCDLHLAPCVAADNAGRSVRFQFTPAHIPLMKELTVQVDVNGIPVHHSAQVVVEGVNMFMGYQRAELRTETAASLTGTLVLPVCTLETMEWQATLAIETPDGKLQAVFPFVTER